MIQFKARHLRDVVLSLHESVLARDPVAVAVVRRALGQARFDRRYGN